MFGLLIPLSSVFTPIQFRKSLFVRVLYAIGMGISFGLFVGYSFLFRWYSKLFLSRNGLEDCHSSHFNILHCLCIHFIQCLFRRNFIFLSFLFVSFFIYGLISKLCRFFNSSSNCLCGNSLFTIFALHFESKRYESKVFCILIYMCLEMVKTRREMLIGVYAALNVFMALELKFVYGQIFSGEKKAKRNLLTKLDIDWVLPVANSCTICGLVLSVFLNVGYLNGSQTCIFPLSSLLLLLHPDRYLFSKLSTRNRYFPMIATISLYLICSALYWLFSRLLLTGLGSFLKNFLLLNLTIPTHYLIGIFVWNFGKAGNQLVWMLITPMNILSAMFSDIAEIQMLGVIGLVCGIVQFFISKEIQQFGKEILWFLHLKGGRSFSAHLHCAVFPTLNCE